MKNAALLSPCVKRKSDKQIYVIVGLVSLLIYFLIYGGYVINPMYTDWLFDSKDLTQHYLGWVAYRNGSWTFPIGLTDKFAYPNYTSVMFTDSIPVFAVIFKIFSPVLPESFQYFGIWGAMCFVLQGCFGVRIFRRFFNDEGVIICGSLLLVLSPVMLFRMYMHTSLGGQWILLYMLDLLFSYEKYSDKRKVYLKIALTGFLASAIHMYFTLMCGIILLGVCMMDFFKSRKAWNTIRFLLDYVASSVFTVGILGGFSSNGTSFVDSGLGYYSMNYNALFNPQGWSVVSAYDSPDWSVFLKNQPLFTNGQYEGLGYIGGGGLLLLTMAVFLLFGSGKIKQFVYREWQKIVSLLLVAAAICFVASGPTASFSDIKLYELTLSESIAKIWGIFRASGRIVMVVSYMVVITSIITVRKSSSRRFSSVVLACCLALQIIDVSAYCQAIHQRFAVKADYRSPLENEVLLNAIGENEQIEHIVLTYWLGEDGLYEIGEYALDNNKTLNMFALVHPDVGELISGAKQLLQSPSEDQVFFFDSTGLEWIHYNNLNFYEAGDYLIGYSGRFEGFTPLDMRNEILALHDIMNIPENGIICFSGDAYNAEPYALGGMSSPESTGTWTDGTKTVIGFSVSDRESMEKLHLSIDLESVINSRQDVAITVNDVEVFNQIVHSESGVISFDVEGSNDGNYIMVIDIPGAVSPKALGLSEDGRNLGLMIKSIKVLDE